MSLDLNAENCSVLLYMSSFMCLHPKEFLVLTAYRLEVKLSLIAFKNLHPGRLKTLTLKSFISDSQCTMLGENCC